MVSLLILTSALLGLDPAVSPPPTPSEELDSYEAALAQVGRDADAHVNLALWCEAHGLEPERLKHLSLAVLNDPAHPLARGLLGLVSYQGRWRRPEAVVKALAADDARKAVVAEYEGRRDRLEETSEAHWKLALWCEENDLKAESIAHLWSSVRLDPSREAAWKRLGYKKHDGRWVTEAQLAREKEEAALQKQADKRWRPILEKWRDLLTAKDPSKHAEALNGLAGVTDPRAVPMVWSVFGAGDEPRQKIAVQVLGQIDAAGASRALAFLAVYSGSDEVRRVATETLRRRDAREYAGPLVDLLRDPIKYEVRPVNGPGSSGSIFIEGQRVNVQRRYNAPPLPYVRQPLGPGDALITGPDGLPVVLRGNFVNGVAVYGADGSYAMAGPGIRNLIPPQQQVPAFVEQMIRDPGNAPSILAANAGNGIKNSSINPQTLMKMHNYWLIARGIDAFRKTGRSNMIQIGQAVLETQRAAATAQQQLMNDVASLDRFNAKVKEMNERVVRVLNDATEQNLPAEHEPWQRWLTNQFGYAQRFSSQPKTTMVVDISPSLPRLSGFESNQNGYVRLMSCFGAGTPVHTLTGTRPIEALRVGDEVLTQDLRTGALGYRPILAVHHNPPSKTFQLGLGGETIVSSEFHRFWKAGKGWVMARDLRVGDTLRTLGGLVTVASVESGTVQPVFNLDVAEDADFFVGARGTLVHDNTLPDLRLPPFDAAPGLAAAAVSQ